MADRKISDLTALTTPAPGDYLPIVDISEAAAASKNKRITVEELMRGVPDGTAAAPSIAFESDPNTGIYNPGADQLAVSTAGTGRLFIDSSGRVGLGTSSPDSNTRFHVSASENTSDPFATDASVTISNYQAAGSNEAASLKFLLGTAPGTNAGSISCHYDSFSAGVNSSLRFYTVYQSAFNSAAERMRIDPQGRVGIGTASPSQKLHVAGGNGSGNTTIGCYGGTSAGDYGLLILGNGSTDKASVNVDAATNDLRFDLRGNDGAFKFVSGASYTERARIDSSGNVGIGASSPGARLQVTAPSSGRSYSSSVLDFSNIHLDGATANSTTSALTFSSGGGGGAAVAFSRDSFVGTYISFWTNSAVAVETATERLRIDSSGNVGIGVASPATSGFNNVIKQSATAGAAGYFCQIADSSSWLGLYSGTSAIDSASLIYPSTGSLRIGTTTAISTAGYTERLRIDSSGNVGIGTSSPTTLLDVNADTVRVRTARTPASATATGDAGEICWDASYIYVCTATNTWKRAALSTW